MEKYRWRYQLENLQSLYRKYSSTPIPSSVFLHGNDNADHVPSLLRVNWQYRDVVQLKRVTYQKSYCLTADQSAYESIGLPEELPGDVLLEAFNGTRRVILKWNRPDAKCTAKSSQYLVVYDRSRVLQTISVKALHEQMEILVEESFAGFTLNAEGTILLCVVQLNEKVASPRESSPATREYDLDRHRYRPNWGERLAGVEHSCIAVIHLASQKLVLIDKPAVSLREPFFYRSEEAGHLSVGCTGLQELPYRLGLAFCSNRISFLLGAQLTPDLSDVVSPVEPEVYYGQSGTLALTSPRVFFDTTTGELDSRVILLERDAGGAHNKSARLVRFSFDSRKAEVIMDNQAKRELLEDSLQYSDIGPLFVDRLPPQCFTTDGRHLLTHSATPLTSKVFAIDLEERQMTPLSGNFPLSHCTVLELQQNWLVAVGSSLSHLPAVYLCDVTHLDRRLQWIPVEAEDASEQLTTVHFETFAFTSRHFADKLVNCIWTRPVGGEAETETETKAPTVIIPHGGPHSQFTTAYNQTVALFTELGLNCCLVNYVGSTGVDESYVDALLGRIGTSDVDDVLDAVALVIEQRSADRERLILYGGSHGGYLVTRIAGQFADWNWLACIARNPGIDVPSKTVTGDIPDWSIAEALGIVGPVPHSQLYVSSGEVAESMFQMSTTAHLGQVRAPTLLLLGSEDRRVPASQGLLYQRILKARGIECRARMYPDGHSLAKVAVECDCFLSLASFLEKYLFG